MTDAPKIKYAELMDRIKAVFTDLIVYFLLAMLVTSLLSSMENPPVNLRITAFIVIFGLYDPLFTSLFGGTIGHLVNGLRVKRDSDTTRNVIFPFAIVRFVVKTFLGFISLFTVSANFESKAIHDMIVKTVVIKRK